MRPTYANVVSTLALVLALGGTGAYAAGKVTGKDIKNNSVSGQDIKNGSLAGPDVAGGAFGADKLSPAVQAALAPQPREATPVDVTIARKGLVPQTLGTFGGVTYTGICGEWVNGESQSGVAMSAVAPGGRAFTTFHYYYSAGPPAQSGTTVKPAGTDGAVPLVPVSNALGDWSLASTTFTLEGSGFTQAGSLTASYDVATGCRIRGWILHG